MLELLSLLTVRDDESVEVAGATDLELGKLSWLALSTNGLGLLDAGGTSVLTTSDFEEVLDVLDLRISVRMAAFVCSSSLLLVAFFKIARGRSRREGWVVRFEKMDDINFL